MTGASQQVSWPKLKASLPYSLTFSQGAGSPKYVKLKQLRTQDDPCGVVANCIRSFQIRTPKLTLDPSEFQFPLSQRTASCRCSLATDALAHAHAAGWPRAQAWGLSGQSSSKANTNIGTQRKASSGPQFYLLSFKSFWFSDETKCRSS